MIKVLSNLFKKDDKTLFCINPGHSKVDPGAINYSQRITEYEFNTLLSTRIFELYNTLSYNCTISATNLNIPLKDIFNLSICEQLSYKDLPSRINKINPKYCISLHCNASEGGKGTGTEVLYYEGSERGKKLAAEVFAALTIALALPPRGCKSRTLENRGGYLLAHVKCPIVIAEPFFIDNIKDLNKAVDNFDKLAEAYLHAMLRIEGLPYGEFL